ncbi:MAG: DNA-directed RNA polymerase subunit alpha [Clostridia bacterium]|nr:DNA-directed RNA polymerase subunit alpha [Clostridia bacterium]
MTDLRFEKPRVERVELSEDGSYGKYTVAPLQRGYGTTLGNSLRRMMLSSLEGAAISSVKIENVQHEFSTIPGVKEDVSEIVLNLKQVIIKLHSDGPKTVYIEAEGSGELCARDIKADSDVEIINGDLHIATLNDDAKLYMEITINKGRGYVSADKNKALLQPLIGLIPVDSIYTPVEKVNYYVENTRVGQNTDFDKLTVEVWTNGTKTADEAISLSAKIINDHMMLFIQLTDEAMNVETMVEKGTEKKEKVLDMTIEELDLSVRSYNCLKRAGINTVEDLTLRKEEEMMKVRNLGRKSLDEVIGKLKELKLSFAPDED